MRLGTGNWEGCELVVPNAQPTLPTRLGIPEAPATPGRPSPADDDVVLDDLPPLDGDLEDAPPTEPDLSDLVDDDGSDGALDDATAENEPVDASELHLPEEAGGLEGAGDAADLELGELVLGGFASDDRPIGEDDHPPDDGHLHEDDAVFQDGGSEHIDVGEEGPVDDEDDVSESRLPDIDADEDDRQEDAPSVVPFEDEPSGLPWAAEPWARVGAPWPVGDATAVACLGRGAIVVGRSESGVVELTRVDLEGGCQAVAASGLEPARVRSLTAEGETVVAKTQDGGLFVSADGGSTFTPADPGGSRVLGELPPGALSAPSAVRGSLVSYGGRKGGIVRGGKIQPFVSVAWEGKVTALAFIDDVGTVAAATYSAADDTTDLIRVSAGGAAVVVARVGPARATGEADGRVVAMAYDDSRGVLWVVGGFGVAAFGGR
jgi:hypothetical protein